MAAPIRGKEKVPRDGVLPAVAIYGANASGKTNVIRAMEFLAGCVRSSHKDWSADGPVPRTPFALDGKSQGAETRLEVDFQLGGVEYNYGFALDNERILAEWLNAYPRGRKQTWFDRRVGGPIAFGKHLSGENRTIEALTRKNSLFLSAAAQNDHKLLLPIYSWLANAWQFVIGDRDGLLRLTAALCQREPRFQARIAAMVSAADVGIRDVVIRSKRGLEPNNEATAGRLVGRVGNPRSLMRPGFLSAFGPSEIRLREEHEFSFVHDAVSVEKEFPAELESHGTRSYVALLGPVVLALEQGGVLWVDELEASLHSLLARQIVTLFQDPKRNPKGAQLIFSTHDTNILTADVLRRDQIWFTEKDKRGATHLYPLTDFKPRRFENLENGYLQGRYGAIPFLAGKGKKAVLNGDGRE